MYADRVKDTTTAPGVGTVTLANAAPTGYQTFAAAFTSGTLVSYCIADQSGNGWEVGTGTFTAPATLTRSTVLASSNGGSLTNFSTGTQDVFCTAPAKYLDTFTSTNQGTVPASGGGTANFLRADGTFAAPPSGSPASPTTSVQFNNSGAFGGSANFTYATSTNTFTVGPAGATTTIETLAPTGATTAGTLRFRGKNASATNGNGGSINIVGGNALGTGTGGNIALNTGDRGGRLTVLTGAAGVSSGTGGDFDIQLGNGGLTGYGGSFYANSGVAGQDQGGTFYILGGGGGVGGTFAMGCGASITGAGGDVTFAMAGGATDDGNIYIQDGLGRNFIQCRNATAGGGAQQIGFFNATPVVKPAVTGSRASGAALQDLLTQLAALGLITDSTTI